MKINLLAPVFALMALGLLSANSQPMPAGPDFRGAMSKLFGDNHTFSATLEMQTTDGSGNNLSMPGQICYDTGKSRFECNLTDAKGSKANASQMKAMGLDQIVAIRLPDQKLNYLICPGLQSYVETKTQKSEADAADYKMEVTEMAKETVDGHPCVKNKVVVTDKDGAKHESTVWNATDLKSFPVKIQTDEHGRDATMLFRNVSLTAPAASQFAPPADYRKYDSMQAMMQMEVMKHMGPAMMNGGMSPPPH